MHKPASAPEGAPTSPRCKVGDLVVVTCAPKLPDLLGAIGTVINAERLPPGRLYVAPYERFSDLAHWLVQFDRPVPAMSWDPLTRTNWKGVHKEIIICDAFLQPLRDGDGTDETLIWAGMPGLPTFTVTWRAPEPFSDTWRVPA